MRNRTDFFDEFVFCGGEEGRWLGAEHWDDAAEGPDVGTRVVFKLLEDFGSLVEQRPSILNDNLGALSVLSSYSKVTQLHSIVLALQKYVLRLDVAMNDILRVQKLQGEEYLDDEFLDALLGEVSFEVVDVGLEVAAIAEFKQNAEELLAIVDEVVHVAADVGVAQLA